MYVLECTFTNAYACFTLQIFLMNIILSAFIAGYMPQYYYIVYTAVSLPFHPLSLSLSLSLTHTHTHIMAMYIVYAHILQV